MLIRSWIAQKLGFLIVVVNICYDFKTFSNSSNFGNCFQIFFKNFRDGAVDNVNVIYYVYVNMGLCLDHIVCLKLGSTVSFWQYSQ